MMIMVSNQSNIAFGYLAGRYPGSIGHLYGPEGLRKTAGAPYAWLPYALDNDRFGSWKNGSAWDEANWRDMLRRALLSGVKPLWALVPDVVGNREETLGEWRRWIGVVREHGFRPAFAVQDGMTFADVPSDDCVLFLGGTTEWKEAAIGPWCRAFPRRVHVGRVNGAHRLLRCWHAGAISVDGTGWFHRKGNQLNDLFRFVEETHRNGVDTQ
jgi:hypothetical protein